MKPSEKVLGLEIQLYLLKQGLQVDDLAREMNMTAEGLSNLIHGRRRFKDDTLERMAETPILKQGNFTLTRLKALRAMDEYRFEEIILSLVEYIRRGEIDRLPPGFFDQFQAELERSGFPPALSDKKHALLALMQEDAS